jgi:DNA-binding transcriptional ArsR family regulator
MAAMKRIYFTDEDLRNVRIGPTYGPLAEAALSLERLVRTDWSGSPAPRAETFRFGGWRERVLPEVGPADLALAQLLPRAMDVITMTGRSPTIDEGLEAVAALRPAIVGLELAGAAEGDFRPPGWAAVLAERATDARKQFAGALRTYHDKAVAPHWPAVSRLLEAERDRAVRRLSEEGIDRFLASCHPTMRWDPPVLSIDSCLPCSDQEARLDGRGVVFVPSLFCPPGYPMCAPADDPDASPILHVPIAPDAGVLRGLWDPPGGTTVRSSLDALLGRTRAAVLDAVAAGPCTTSELARRVGVSVPSASEHAAVLRDADLIVTRRAGRAVLHTVTSLGAGLLDGSPVLPAIASENQSGSRAERARSW